MNVLPPTLALPKGSRAKKPPGCPVQDAMYCMASQLT